MKTNKEWMSISDMMAGLMMVFMFIAIVFMQKIYEDKKSMLEIAQTYQDTKIKLNEALHSEFDKDLVRWGAELTGDNTIIFHKPEVLFDRGKWTIKPKFKDILNDFFPRYLAILTHPDFKGDIVELRVEGHTSSEWKSESSLEESYLKNAYLSQQRSFSVVGYLFSMEQVVDHREWLIKVFRANGLAFAKLVFKNGVEDKFLSRRVEFRVMTNTENRIKQILEKASVGVS